MNDWLGVGAQDSGKKKACHIHGAPIEDHIYGDFGACRGGQAQVFADFHSQWQCLCSAYGQERRRDVNPGQWLGLNSAPLLLHAGVQLALSEPHAQGAAIFPGFPHF